MDVIGDTLQKAEETFSKIFPMTSQEIDNLTVKTIGERFTFPQYSQRTVPDLPGNPEEIHQKLIELDENPKVFPWLKTEVMLWLARLAYHGYDIYHHSWDNSHSLFKKIRGNPDFTPEQQAIAELYLAHIYRLEIPGRESYEPIIKALTAAKKKASSEETKRIAGIYLDFIQAEQQRIAARSKRSGDENNEEEPAPKRQRIASHSPRKDEEKPMNID